MQEAQNSAVSATKKRRGKPFQKGKSGNPGGRPKALVDVQALAREHTEEAVMRMVHWMRSDNPKASASCAAAILDRAWGKAVQAVEAKGAIKIIIVDEAA